MMISRKRSISGSAFAISHISYYLKAKFKTDKLEDDRSKVACATLVHSLRSMYDNEGFSYFPFGGSLPHLLCGLMSLKF